MQNVLDWQVLNVAEKARQLMFMVCDKLLIELTDRFLTIEKVIKTFSILNSGINI